MIVFFNMGNFGSPKMLIQKPNNRLMRG